MLGESRLISDVSMTLSGMKRAVNKVDPAFLGVIHDDVGTVHFTRDFTRDSP